MPSCSFTKADIERAVAGAKGAGMDVGRVEIELDPFRIIILSAAPTARADGAEGELDAELTSFVEARHGHD